MRVEELAKDLNVSADTLVLYLRQMGIAVGDPSASVGDADVARILARVEKDRRAAGKESREVIEAAIEDAQSSKRRRRRRRRSEPEEEAAPQPDPDSEPPAPSGAADAEDSADEPSPTPGAGVDGGEADETEVAAAGPTGEEATEPPDSESPVSVEGDERSDVPEAPAAAPPPTESPEAEAPASPKGAEKDAEAEPAPEPAKPKPVAPGRAKGRRSAKAEGDEKPDPDPVESGGDGTPAHAGSGQDASDSSPPAPARQADGERSSGRRIRRKAKDKEEGAKPAPAASAGPGGKVRIQAEGYTEEGRRKKKKGKKRQRVDQDSVQDNVQRVMAELKGGGGGGGKKRRRRSRQAPRDEAPVMEDSGVEEEREIQTVKVNEYLTPAELGELIDVPPTDIIGSAFKNLGLMVTVNQRLDFDQIELLLDEFGYRPERQEAYGEEQEDEGGEEEDPDALLPRPPVVAVMGHVDHGKTLLLDHIRKSNVVAGESGGITQHIGAYHVETDQGDLTFLDTPGHEAFTAMRARGADVTDVVILVVAADDSIMPQTIEAISHAKNAGVPIVVAINKIDLPGADANRVRQELLQHEVTVEEFGGDVLSAEVSAKTGQGMDDLVEKLLLQAEILDLKANPDRSAQGTVIEAKKDVGKGPVVTVMVRKGTLRVGDDFVVGSHHGRVRALLDERGRTVREAGPAVPVQLLGCPGVPEAGDNLTVMAAEKAQQISQTRQRLDREKQLRIKERGIKLGDFSELFSEGETSRLPLIVKADVQGSVQALADSLQQLNTDEVGVDIIHHGTGAVNESDVLLAQTASAVIVAFRVRPDTNARTLAEREGVDIQAFEVIYDAVDQVRNALEGMLAPEEKEQVLGTAEVRETFKISGVGTVAGCYVTQGVIRRNGRVRLIRDGTIVYTGDIDSLKRFKEDVREVRESFECGLGIKGFNDVKVGDVIECFAVEVVQRTLAGAAAERGS